MKKWVLIFGILATGSICSAQVSVYVNTYSGLGYSVFRDIGVSPITYQGVSLQPAFGATIEWDRWHIEHKGSLSGSVHCDQLFPLRNIALSGYGGIIESTNKGSYLWHHSGHWSIWSGIAINNYLGIKYIPRFMNASYAVDDFIKLSIHCRAEYTLKRFTFHGELQTAPFCICFRPGFSYIDNHTASMSFMECLFSSYEWNCIAFPNIESDIGATLNLNNGNKIRLAYRWDFFSTRNAGAWRYEEARHLIELTLCFKL